MIRVGVLAAVLIAGCSCADIHEPSDADLDAPRRVHEDTNVDAGPCTPDPGICLSDDDCIDWGARVAPPGTFPATRCGHSCTLGLVNCITYEGRTTCDCSLTAPQTCQAGEICVADTLGGPTRCAEACAGH